MFGYYIVNESRINIGQAQAKANLFLRPESMAQPVFMAKMEIAKLDPQPNRHLQIIVSLTPYGPAIG